MSRPSPLELYTESGQSGGPGDLFARLALLWSGFAVAILLITSTDFGAAHRSLSIYAAVAFIAASFGTVLRHVKPRYIVRWWPFLALNTASAVAGSIVGYHLFT